VRGLSGEAVRIIKRPGMSLILWRFDALMTLPASKILK
jgi:hypothetical protein